MQRITLLNPKGGCGKTTIATSLAAYYASQGWRTVLVDYDAQGSSTRWLQARPQESPAIHGIAAYRSPTGVTRSWHLRVPVGTERVVTDTPASLKGPQLGDLVRSTDSILIPVLPSCIDIDAVSDFIEGLRQIREVRRGEQRIAVVANRTRGNTEAFRDLERMLAELDFGIVARLRDSYGYIRAGEGGAGIHELGSPQTIRDRVQWAPLLAWVEQRSEREFTPREALAGRQRQVALST